MKKIAIILIGDLSSRKGKTNAEINRAAYLKKISPYSIDVFSFQIYDGLLARLLRHTSKQGRKSVCSIDGIDIRCFWRPFSIIDYILSIKLKKSPIINKGWMNKYIANFNDYDLVVTNSCDGGEFAYEIKKRFGIPYCVTWHGTDVHTAPFNSKYEMQQTRNVMEGAQMNFMVSSALLDVSYKITNCANRMVLYNGVNSLFRKFSDIERSALKKQFEVEEKKVVAFAGYIEEVKNPQLLPLIFASVYKSFGQYIEFWIIGDGKMRSYVESQNEQFGIPVRMWGNQPVEKMPSLLNCIDVLVLPSRNEGLPLITVEALACGANVVGANVGGIPESIGVENVFDHGAEFVEKISSRILKMLQQKIDQPLSDKFSWENTARVENEYYQSIIEQ